jgi:hypothetical protein
MGGKMRQNSGLSELSDPVPSLGTWLDAFPI